MAAMSPAAPTEGIKGRLACALCESGRPKKLLDPKPGSIKKNGCDRRDRRRLEKFRDIPATVGRAELGGADGMSMGSKGEVPAVFGQGREYQRGIRWPSWDIV